MRTPAPSPARTPGASVPAPVLSPMLQRLAAERATGALMRDRGTLYLADGKVVHAESPATPGIDVLLTRGGALRREGWWDAVAQAGAGQRVGRYLVDSGRVPGGALELCHLGALYDAAFFALAPTRAPARFRYGVAHWIGPVRPVPVDAVQRETLRRRELLDRIWPESVTDTAPLVGTGRPADSPYRRTGAAYWSAWTGCVRRRTSRRSWAGRRSTPWSTCAGWRPPDSSPRYGRRPTRPSRIALPEVTADPDVALLRRLRDALEAL